MAKQVVWFVRPLDDATNAVIARMKAGSAEDFIEKKDGIENLWVCPNYSFISALNRVKTMSLRFKVYRTAGKGKLEEWKFLRKRKA